MKAVIDWKIDCSFGKAWEHRPSRFVRLFLPNYILF